MENRIDFTLYDQLKAYFKAEEGKIILINITTDNFADLKPQVFSNAEDFDAAFWKIKEQERPRYALVDFLDAGPTFGYVCSEFTQEQCLETGKVLFFKKNPSPSRAFDLENVKEEFVLLEELLRNSQAS